MVKLLTITGLTLMSGGALLSQAPSFGSAKEWAEFGLAGLVIGALFVVCGYVVRWALNQTKILSDLHRDEREEMRTEAREERREWSAAQARRDERMDAALSELTGAIREAGRLKE